MPQGLTKDFSESDEDRNLDMKTGWFIRLAGRASQGVYRAPCRALVGATCVFAVIILSCGVARGAGGQAQGRAGLTPQKIVSLLSQRPNYLPVVPFKGPDGDDVYFSYWAGTFQPVSGSLKADGMIAYFVMAFDYRMLNPTTAFAYRIFRDDGAAQKFFSNMSVANQPNLVAPGFVVGERKDPAGGTTFEKRGLARQPVVCDFYATAAAPDVAVTRCSALANGFPVIVSGVRTETIDVGEANQQGTPFRTALEQSEQSYSLGALGNGLVRLQAIAAGR